MGVLGSTPLLLISETESLKSEAVLVCGGRLNVVGDKAEPTERPEELKEFFCVKEPLLCSAIISLPEFRFNPV